MTSSVEAAEGRAELRTGDCRKLFKDLETDSIGSIISDPPYELGFMGNGWDDSGIAYDIDMWKEAYRVLKPGHYLAAFSGTRTVHRMTMAIEDAGFQLVGQMYWTYGTGFPKSLNVAKAVDKHLGKKGVVIGTNRAGKTAMMRRLRGDDDKGEWGARTSGPHTFDILGPESEEAKAWDGWGTQLKPAYEPVIIAFKPAAGIKPRYFKSHRFNYIGKASTAERELGMSEPIEVSETFGEATPTTKRKNIHVTVKPIEVMRWLIDLLHPAGDVCLDPFMGSGSTGLALLIEHPESRFLGFDLTPAYVEVAKQRIDSWRLHFEAKEPLAANRAKHGLGVGGDLGSFFS
tara:strand:- start:2666 stop:3700 length:1035 start_codon:yes stop_codon:yes gene_type:complete